MYKITRNATVLGVGLGISAFIGWLLMREGKRAPQLDVIVKSRLPESEGMPEIPLPLEDLQDDEDEDAQTQEADDLTEIRGIGPNYAQALRQIGVSSFEQLAQQNPEDLAERLALHVNIGPLRIREYDWIGQAARKAQR